jgi:hypothetical protein
VTREHRKRGVVSLDGHSGSDLIMQNRYVGDIGDYLKLGILRALSPGYHVGIAWWLYPDETHNRDGRHIDYLNRPERWRHFDPDLFDALAKVVSSGQRDVQALEAANLLPGAIFASEVIPVERRVSERPQRAADGSRLSNVGSKMPISCSWTPTTVWSLLVIAPAQPRLAKVSCLVSYGNL